jgi:hypothetical protein
VVADLRPTAGPQVEAEPEAVEVLLAVGHCCSAGVRGAHALLGGRLWVLVAAEAAEVGCLWSVGALTPDVDLGDRAHGRGPTVVARRWRGAHSGPVDMDQIGSSTVVSMPAVVLPRRSGRRHPSRAR